MRLIENTVIRTVPITEHITKRQWMEDNERASYFCLYCGGPDQVMGFYTEEVYGTADITDANGAADNYEQQNSGDTRFTEYKCTECNRERDNLEDLITDDIERGWEVYKEYNQIGNDGEEVEEE